VRDGIVIIPKNTVLPDGTFIGPDSSQQEQVIQGETG